MIAAGGAMMMIVLLTGFLLWKEKLVRGNCLLRILPLLLPLPFIANSVGWYIAEAGRQPWIVVGLQKTAEAVSPNLSAGEVWLTLIGFTVIYLLLAIAALYIAFRFIRKTLAAEEGRVN